MIYKSLFNINFHHGYFLDSGNKKFTTTNGNQQELSALEKEKSLLNYNFLDFLKVSPLPETSLAFANHRLLLRTTKEGISLWSSTQQDSNSQKFIPIISFDLETEFTFEVSVSDFNFDYYTDISEDANRLFLFTNKKPNTEPISFPSILSGNGKIVDDNFLLSQQGSRDLILQIVTNNKDKYRSVIERIWSIESDTSLDQTEQTKEKNLVLDTLIQKHRKKGILGYLALSVKGDSTDLVEFSNGSQFALSTPPSEIISFLNKQSFWKYISLKDNVNFTTTEKYWLAKNGFIKIEASDFPASSGSQPNSSDPSNYKFPNPEVALTKKQGNDYYSEIYI